MIKKKKEEIEQENSGLREWIEDNDEVGNICDLYYKM